MKKYKCITIKQVDLKKIDEYLKTSEAEAELERIANTPIQERFKPTWDQLNTPMDI